jgi:hypothetical protein
MQSRQAEAVVTRSGQDELVPSPPLLLPFLSSHGSPCTVDYLTNRLLHRLHSDCVDSASTRACPAVPAIPQARFSYKQRGRFWGCAWLIQTSSQALHILATRSSPHTRNTTYLIDTPWYLLGMPTTTCTGPWPVVTPVRVHGVRRKMPRTSSATSGPQLCRLVFRTSREDEWNSAESTYP